MPDVLFFVRDAQGHQRAVKSVSTTGGSVVTPSGQIVTAALVSRNALSLLLDENGSTVQALFLPDNFGETVVAQAKLLQRFLVHLMTERGSFPYRPDQGCSFVTQLRNGRVTNELDVFTAFATATIALRKNLQGEEEATDPSEERYVSSRISRLIVTPGSLVAQIDVTNRAGVKLNLLVPLNFRL